MVLDDDGKVSLIDFGLSAAIEGGSSLTTTDEGFGTQAFSAPECSPGSYDRASSSSDIYSLGKLFYWLVSNGRLVNRELFDERHIARIDDANPWLRNAAAHLVIGAVQEATARRWSAEELLVWIDWLDTKITQHQAHDDRGQVIVWDGLGPAGEVNRSGSKSVSFRSSHYYDHKMGIGFEIPDESDPLRLEEIALGVGLQAGSGRLTVTITTDQRSSDDDRDRRLPDLKHPLEVLLADTPSRNHTTLRIQSITKPSLVPGRRYWICLEAPDPGTTVAWYAPQVAYIHVPAWIARYADEYPEGRAGRIKAPGYALQVTATSS